MKIYCVLSWITIENTRKKSRVRGKDIENMDRLEVYYTKPKAAHADYNARVRDMDMRLSCSYRGERRTGRVKLFIPHVHKNGALAYWPDDKYIAEYTKCDQQP